MKQQVNTWAPTLKDNDEPTESLRVPCGPEAPANPQEYRERLQDRLEFLIMKDPDKAQSVLEENATAESPDLSNILAQSQPQEWAVQIASSAQTAMLIARIDWQKTSPVQKLSGEDLPNLEQLLQLI